MKVRYLFNLQNDHHNYLNRLLKFQLHIQPSIFHLQRLMRGLHCNVGTGAAIKRLVTAHNDHGRPVITTSNATYLWQPGSAARRGAWYDLHGEAEQEHINATDSETQRWTVTVMSDAHLL